MTMRALLVLFAVSVLAPLAQAHDSWFEALPTPRAGEVRLALGTGNRFPKMETSVGAGALVAHGCRHGAAKAPLRIQRDNPQALLLRAAPTTAASRKAGHGAITCWAQLVPFEAQIDAATVELYFKEINASAAVREAWREMQSRGVVWRERYVKHVRLEHFDARLGERTPPAAAPAPMGLDIVFDGALRPPRVGEIVAFQVLRDGQPLPDFALELQSALTPVGLWLKTDAQGRASVRLPLAGNYLLRGVDLRVSTTAPDTWDSRFIMLGFEALKP
jgi:Domain of unknown function (DUF4198)